MRNFYVNLLVVLSLSFCASAQNKLRENESYQKKIQFTQDISQQQAISFFARKNGLDANNTFAPKKETSDQSGLVHQRHQQFYKNLKIEFGTLITHSRNGNVVSINAELYNAQSLNLTPSLDAIEGLNKAISDINAVKYLWDDAKQAQIVNYQKPQGELVVFPIVKTGEVRLAYKYDIYTIEPLSRQDVYVDAHNGQVLFKNQIIKHATSIQEEQNPTATNEILEALITGNANTKYSGARSIETRFDAPLNMFVLNDQTRGAEIVTYNCERIVATYQNVHFKDNDNNWTTVEHANSFLDNAAQDGHWGSEKTYDFWKNIFNRDGYDDNNSMIRSYVHYKQTTANFNNAFWNGAFMTYGDGANKPFTAIDVVGHEIGHAVTQYTANLVYENHSGAINEGYSDIYGACIEHYGRTGALTGTPVTNVWRIGEDIVSPSLRSMSSPLTLGDPDTFRGTNWIVTGDDGACVPSSANDRCGVHSNSGVMNHWFYILTIGKSGTNNAPIAERDTYSVAGIGMVKSVQIAYFAERDYLTPNSTYFDARDATIAVAGSLYCGSGPEVLAVTNAWFAVNIGTSFQAYTNEINLKDVSSNNSSSCNVTSVSPTITFENLGTNPITSVNISYTIDGGAATNATWTGNLSTCSLGTYQINVNTASLSVGRHIISFTTTISGDVIASNNTKATYIFVNQATAINQVNTFEATTDNLIAYDASVSNFSLWERGTSTKTVLNNAVAGSNVYATNLTGYYPNNAKSYLMSRCYDLSQAQNPILKFDMAFDLEYSYDILYIEYSINGGLNWNHLGTDSNTNWYNGNTGCQNCVGVGEWTGGADNSSASGLTNGTKQPYSYNLSAFGIGSASPQSSMLFRFVFHSDTLENTYDGAIIDNFVVETTLATDQNTLNDFAVYPNPTTANINIAFTSNSDEKVNLTLYDVQGRLIKSNIAESSVGNFNYVMDILNVPTGFYLLKISQGNLNYNAKIIKK